MRVFISSVRTGLEVERDALPGLVRALGHVPVTFEDFTAQTIPSREACLTGVASADVYVLLLGPNYGYRFPETNQSPTHDEWTAARAAGMPTFVFRKLDVELERAQQEFVDMVGSYGSGVFHGQFEDVADLQVKVAEALVNHAAQPSPLVFTPLADPVAIQWKGDWGEPGRHQQDAYGSLELHVVALDAAPIPARMMVDLPNRLAGSIRALGAVSMTAGLTPSGDSSAATIAVMADDSRSSVADATLRGIRVGASGQLSLWWSLPRDGMGSILDETILLQNLMDGLRVVGGINVLTGDRFAVAAGIGGSAMVGRGTFTGIERRSATGFKLNPKPARAVLDEAVTSAALDRGAPEVARPLVTLVLADFDKTW
ncbi:DUF4062 domain-containing protein [Promicromonospora sp. NPDC090134]|uniref:DUF4062 domain-containing protein n=1 Tax=Promicromonospora sp. NPDC090134 TaxID=3364408 RepID=UPI003809C8FA